MVFTSDDFRSTGVERSSSDKPLASLAYHYMHFDFIPLIKVIEGDIQRVGEISSIASRDEYEMYVVSIKFLLQLLSVVGSKNITNTQLFDLDSKF